MGSTNKLVALLTFEKNVDQSQLLVVAKVFERITYYQLYDYFPFLGSREGARNSRAK